MANGDIYLGRMYDGSPIKYSIRDATNPNVGICGTSGSGKTFTIKQLVRGYMSNGITTYILDVHGDLGEIDGVPESYFNNIEFSYLRGNGTINPLRVYPNEGPFIAVSNFVEVVKIFSPSFGSRQVSLLKKLVRD